MIMVENMKTKIRKYNGWEIICPNEEPPSADSGTTIYEVYAIRGKEKITGAGLSIPKCLKQVIEQIDNL